MGCVVSEQDLKIHIPYVVADTDRHGNVRVYYRRNGRKVRLHQIAGTAAFAAEVEAAKSLLDTGANAKSSDDGPGTLRRLCAEYFASAPFVLLDLTTQARRRAILEGICQSTLTNGRVRGGLPFARMNAVHVDAIRDEKLDKPEAANMRVKALRQLFKWAKKARKADNNPAAEVEYLPSIGYGFHTWTEAQVRQYWDCHPVGTTARLAIDLLLYTGVRRSDVVRLGPEMEFAGVSADGSPVQELHFTEWKGSRSRVRRRKEGPKNRQLPILSVLRESIDATPTGLRTYLVTSFGRPFTANGFGNRFRKWCDDAALPPECAAHGLRKAGATFAAENNATEYQLMALFGWDSPKQAAIYTRKANQRRLAASAVHLVVPGENRGGAKVSHQANRAQSHRSKNP